MPVICEADGWTPQRVRTDVDPAGKRLVFVAEKNMVAALFYLFIFLEHAHFATTAISQVAGMCLRVEASRKKTNEMLKMGLFFRLEITFTRLTKFRFPSTMNRKLASIIKVQAFLNVKK